MRRLPLLLALSAGTALTGEPAPHMKSVHYLCERGVGIPATYINPAEGEGLAVIVVEGKQVALRQGRSGSGVRYIALDEQDSYRWHTKGDRAVLSWLAADHTAEEQVLLRDCTLQP